MFCLGRSEEAHTQVHRNLWGERGPSWALKNEYRLQLPRGTRDTGTFQAENSICKDSKM